MNRSNSTSIRSGSTRRHAQAVADRRVGRRAASLAQDASLSGRTRTRSHTVRKYASYSQFLDERQLVLDQRAHFLWHSLRISLVRAPSQARSVQILAGALSPPGPVHRIFILQLIERERASLGDLQRPRNRFRRPAQRVRDFLDRPQMPLGIGEAMLRQPIDRRSQSRRRQHFIQRLPGRRVIMHIARRHERQAGLL